MYCTYIYTWYYYNSLSFYLFTTIPFPLPAHPKPSIKWYKDKKRIKDNKSCVVSCDHEKREYTLELKDISISDSGDYMIKVTNSEGELTVSVSVTVLSVNEQVDCVQKTVIQQEDMPVSREASVDSEDEITGLLHGPVFLTPPTPIVVSEGDTAVVTCTLKGLLEQVVFTCTASICARYYV